jgi:hypothetical protein
MGELREMAGEDCSKFDPVVCPSRKALRVQSASAHVAGANLAPGPVAIVIAERLPMMI